MVKIASARSIWWIILLMALMMSVSAEMPKQQYNKMFLNPFYRISMTNNVNYDYTIAIDPPGGISSVQNAMINFQIYITPTVSFVLRVNGQACNPDTFQISTTYMDAGYSVISFDCSNIITGPGTYNVQLRPSGANTGAVYGWLDLTYMDNPAGTTDIFGTEYYAGQEGTIFLQLKDNQGLPENSGACYLDIYYPNLPNQTHPQFIDSAPMMYKEDSAGLYYYDLVVPQYEGVYMLSATCSYQYSGTFVYSVEGEETNYPERTSIAGTYIGSSVFLNDFEDWIYTQCSSTGGGTKACEAYYDFNTTIHTPNLTNVTQIELFYMGESSNTPTMTFYYWNWNTAAWVTLPNTLTFVATGAIPAGVGQFSSNSIAPANAISNDGIIRIRTRSVLGTTFVQYDNWLNMKILTEYGTIQEIKGSGEIHVSKNALSQLNESLANITNRLDLIYVLAQETNQTTHGIQAYLENNITPSLNALQADLTTVLYNQNVSYQFLTEIQANITENYQELQILKYWVQGMNSTLVQEINENEQKLDILNNTVNMIYSQNLNIIIPKLDSIQSNISVMQTKLDDIYAAFGNITVNVDVNLTEVYSQLGYINQSISFLQSNVTSEFSLAKDKADNIHDEVKRIEWKLDCNNTINIVCDKLDELLVINQQINWTLTGLDDYVRVNQTARLEAIYSLLGEVNLTVSGIDTYLQGTIYPAIDDLESNVTTILFKLDEIQGNQTSTYSLIQDLQQNITNTYLKLDILEGMLYSINTSIISEINENEARLDLLNLTLQSMNNYLLGYITTILQDINNSNTLIYSYLQNTIYPAIDDVEGNLQDVLTNQSNLMTKLDDLDTDIAGNYAKLLYLESLVINTNQTLYLEINENEQKLDLLNASVYLIYDKLNNSIEPKLDQLQLNLTDARYQIDFLVNYSYLLSGNQQLILANLSAISVQISNLSNEVQAGLGPRFDLLEEYLMNISTETRYIEAKLDCNHTVNIVCDAITDLQSRLVLINGSVENIYSYLQYNTSVDLGNLYALLSEVNMSVAGIQTYLNTTVEARFDSIDGDLQDLMLNATNTWDKLVLIHQNVSDNNQRLQYLEQIIINVNDTQTTQYNSIVSEIDQNEAYLASMNMTVTQILTFLQTVVDPKLDNINLSLVDIQNNLTDLSAEVEQNHQEVMGNLSYIIANLAVVSGNFSQLSTDIANLHSDVLSINQSTSQRLDGMNLTLEAINQEVQNIEAKLDCNFTVNMVCDMLQEIQFNLSVVQNNTQFIQQYLVYDITNILQQMNITLTNTNINVSLIYNLLFGINASNPFPLEVDIYTPSGDGFRYVTYTPVEFYVNTTSGDDINYTRLRVLDSGMNILYENITLFGNVTDANVSGLPISYNWGLGEYAIVAEAWDMDGNYGRDILAYEVVNQIPETPAILSPNTGGTFTQSLNVSWDNTLDLDNDPLMAYLEYTKDGTTWQTLTSIGTQEIFISHDCGMGDPANSTGDFVPNLDTFLNRINTTIANYGLYYIELSENGVPVFNGSGNPSECLANESCSFYLPWIPLTSNNTYNWTIKDLSSGILADSYSCPRLALGWLGGGNKTTIDLAATPANFLYNWNIAPLPNSLDYNVRVRTFDGYDYSPWDSADTDFTIVKATGVTGSGSGGTTRRGDFMYCNIATNQCYTRDQIEGTPKTAAVFGFLPATSAGGIDFKEVMSNFGNKITGGITNVGHIGESFGIPFWVFLLAVAIIILLIYVGNRQ